MTVRVAFRADASSVIGDGHVMRCLTLARAFAAEGTAITLVSHALAPAHHARWTSVGASVVDSPAPMGDDEHWWKGVAARLGGSLVVLDGYAYAPTYADVGIPTLALDDLGDRPLGASIVLNPNVYGASVSYAGLLSPGAMELLGPSYALLRGEFLEARAQVDAPRGGKNVLVSLGGADPLGATEPVLRALATLPGVAVRALVGASNPRRDELRGLAAELPSCDVLVDVADVARHAAWASAAVVAAGGTCLELACVGVPALTVTTAGNQRTVAAAFDRAGAMRSMGAWPARDLASEVSRLLDDAARRAVMFSTQRALVDGHGAARAAKAALAALADRIDLATRAR